ncbi:uncharacterized protein LOC125027574 isoform X2 [Penaeus chinensis]|uniref:uncharacterized protein LOC125027574 isoform X2 n=1 Tax=Penaeus chinensis TaxID=139456 RepID=UPI001FB7877A|nr:uncharacterized protein LOC125027574 isoform X2 [Penaeus chinensis]
MGKLQEIRRRDLPKLRDELASYLPDSATIYGTLEILLNYGTLKNWETRVFTTRGKSSTLVVTTPMCTTPESQSLSVFWDCNMDEDLEVTAALSTLPGFNWDKPFFLYACPIHLHEKLSLMIENRGLGTGKLHPERLVRAHLYTITSETLTTPRLPKGFEIRRTDPQFAEHMRTHWRYQDFESIEAYEQLIHVLPGYAIFETPKADEESQDPRGKAHPTGAPVSWVHMSRSNTMGNTFTHPEYRRRGLAQAVTLALAAHVTRQSGKVSVYVSDENEASVAFHKRLGFTRECTVGWQAFS